MPNTRTKKTSKKVSTKKTKIEVIDIDDEVIEHEMPKMTIDDISDEKIKSLEDKLTRETHVKDILKKIKNIKNKTQVAKDIEKSIFEFSLIYSTIQKYCDNMYLAVYNDKLDQVLEDLNNEYILERLSNKEINLKYIAFYSPQQLNPKKWDDVTTKLAIIEKKKEVKHYSDLYKCFKCGEKKTVVRQGQTRSADEPMTNFITCVVCGEQWKRSAA